MYQCPRASCEADPAKLRPDAFKVEAVTVGWAMLNAAGEETAFKPTSHDHAGHVYCAHCGARAEWIDNRQGELFPTAPTLCEI